MSDSQQQTSSGSRSAERRRTDRQVSIRFSRDALVGNGQNISEQGVFFVAEGRVVVEVEIEGREGVLQGELVRTENMGSGSVGIAVKFDEPHPGLVDG